jgi:hypothetical protein
MESAAREWKRDINFDLRHRMLPYGTEKKVNLVKHRLGYALILSVLLAGWMFHVRKSFLVVVQGQGNGYEVGDILFFLVPPLAIYAFGLFLIFRYS